MSQTELVAPPAPPMSPQRIYRPAWNSRASLWAVALTALAVALADLALQLLRYGAFDSFTAIATVNGAGMGVFTAALVRAGLTAATDLTTTEGGIAYRSPFAAHIVPWADVVAVRAARWRPLGDRLVVRDAGRLRTVPLAAFARNWRTAPLAGDLRRHAPWLFD